MNAQSIKINGQVIELGDKSLGVENAAVGNILSVKEIDENGKPTAWGVSSGGGISAKVEGHRLIL